MNLLSSKDIFLIDLLMFSTHAINSFYLQNESSSLLGCGLDGGGSGGEDTLMTPLLDETTTFNTEFSFEFCDNTYR